MPSATRRAPSGERSTTATAAPAAARVRQNCSPSSPAPPVTSATRPSRENFSQKSGCAIAHLAYVSEVNRRKKHPPISQIGTEKQICSLRLNVSLRLCVTAGIYHTTGAETKCPSRGEGQRGDGGIRTRESGLCRPLPSHLATSPRKLWAEGKRLCASHLPSALCLTSCVERAMGLEPTTFSLARRRSTN